MAFTWNCACFLLGLVAAVSGIACNMPPSLWCSTKEIATSCGVYDQCFNSVKPDSAAEPVNFSLYYESECEGCKTFIQTQLYPTYTALGPTVMNLTMVPYGNAKEKQKPFSHKWVFTCQHGEDECVGNLIETCAIMLVKNKTTWFKFIHCIEQPYVVPEHAAKKCAPKFNIDFEQIMKCAQGATGMKYEHMMALITGELNPPHTYVPWVTLNSVHTEDIQNKAMKDLLSLICETYKGPKPDACRQQEMLQLTTGRCFRNRSRMI